MNKISTMTELENIFSRSKENWCRSCDGKNSYAGF